MNAHRGIVKKDGTSIFTADGNTAISGDYITIDFKTATVTFLQDCTAIYGQQGHAEKFKATKGNSIQYHTGQGFTLLIME